MVAYSSVLYGRRDASSLDENDGLFEVKLDRRRGHNLDWDR